MSTIVRRVRAVLSLAALWGLITGALGLTIALVIAVRRSQYGVLSRLDWWWADWHGFVGKFAGSWAMAGALIAIGFAGFVVRAERGRGVMALSGARFARWGALAGGGVYMAWWVAMTELRGRSFAIAEISLLSLLTSIVIGAGSAWLTLRLARRANLESQVTEPEDDSAFLLSAGALNDVPRPATSRAEVR